LTGPISEGTISTVFHLEKPLKSLQQLLSLPLRRAMKESVDPKANFEAAEASAGQMFHEDTKEGPGDGAPLISEFAGISRSQTIRKFWHLFIAGLAPTLGGM
jgi:hypothetical protein